MVRVAEFYSGIGGLHLALKRSQVSGNVVRAFDWDPAACQVYEANNGPGIVETVDISRLTADYLASLNTDFWMLSPSCQPYTVLNPMAKGEDDPRAKSFLYLIGTVLPDLIARNKHPSRLLVENVAGFENASSRQFLLTTLRNLGYTTFECLLTPLQFGIPNSRLRYYLLAKKAPLDFPCQDGPMTDAVWKCLPGHIEGWNDSRNDDDLKANNVAELRTYLDLAPESSDSASLAIPERILHKFGHLFDIRLPSSRRTCCFTRGYRQLIRGAGSILQMNEDLDTTTIFNQFMRARDSQDPEALKILHPLGLRYFSPTEQLRLFDFDPTANSGSDRKPLIWPSSISFKMKYRLIGNSVNVKVVTELINFLFE